MPTTDPNVTSYVDAAAPDLRRMLNTLRATIHKAVPATEETIKWSQPVFAAPKDFCYLKANKDSVNIGFMEGASLHDPDGLLVGTGKQMRHVKIRPGEDVPTAQLHKLLKQAAKHA